jgi:hypothetical protein
MLELDAAVHRHEDIIFAPHAAQELAIFLIPAQPRETTVSTA